MVDRIIRVICVLHRKSSQPILKRSKIAIVTTSKIEAISNNKNEEQNMVVVRELQRGIKEHKYLHLMTLNYKTS